MKLVSFNVNGLRARLHQLEAVIENHQPFVLGLQETKVSDDQFPHAALEKLGMHVEWFGQKGHYGVALLSKTAPRSVKKGFDPNDVSEQKRIIQAEYVMPDGQLLTVINGYFPQGENRSHPEKFPNKAQFYAGLLARLQQQQTPDQNLVLMGDMNVAPTDLDIGIGDTNARRWLREGKCCFLPEEREWLLKLQKWGLFDTFRERHPDDATYSWFDYRSRGFEREPKRGLRIDLILATASLQEKLQGAGVDHEVRGMEKPSDHCPVWSEFRL